MKTITIVYGGIGDKEPVIEHTGFKDLDEAEKSIMFMAAYLGLKRVKKMLAEFEEKEKGSINPKNN